MNTATQPEIVFTATDVANICSVPEVELKNFEPADFGSPGHWYMRGRDVIYTAAGIEALARGFAAIGKPAPAHSLRTALSARLTVPNRPQWWQTGPMS